MLSSHSLPPYDPLRESIANAYRMDETACIQYLLPQATFNATDLQSIEMTAKSLVEKARYYYQHEAKVEKLLHQYDLSTDEGIALMCLAEALLRIPNKSTMDALITDKLSNVNWQSHLNKDNQLFVNAATWSLLLTGKVYAPLSDKNQTMLGLLKRAMARVGVSMIRPVILQMMKIIGKQFVVGETIQEALSNAQSLEKKGYRFSFDMLGEAARTRQDAERYYQAYRIAIAAIGAQIHYQDPISNNGISIKLSALHPRYEYVKYDQVMLELPPLLLSLAHEAKKFNMNLTVDAEEADRLDLSLDIFAKVFQDESLNGWEGLGLAVQAYQKRASFVIDWLATLAQRTRKRIMVRLVKGAYWDAEIKYTQQNGFIDYPVFTRKHSTDLSYLACANKILANPACFYGQFGTHNAYSIAAIMALSRIHQHKEFEFQSLHGMGRPLYDQIIENKTEQYSCRIYAPVGSHKDLLGYLIRRLLENGANSSFINHLVNDRVPIEKVITNPVARIANLESKPHPKIPLPENIYQHWQNSMAIDFSNTFELKKMKIKMDRIQTYWTASSLVNGKACNAASSNACFAPFDLQLKIGHTSGALTKDIQLALQSADASFTDWAGTSIERRVEILLKAADLFQKEMPQLITLLVYEGGRTILDAMSEVREAIDYCRYYAYQAQKIFKPQVLPGPTGESNLFTLHPRGVIACISPWNFPLAIFCGQIIAALAAGNTVIAKPAEQTPLVGYQAINILHAAGVPKTALQLVLGDGEVGGNLINDERIAGVIFTGSTETAQKIAQTLAKRKGPIATFIAETGGQNAMIVDSSALLEQAVIDIAQSAFNSAGQRCSALRVLYIQTEIADQLCEMLRGYMNELSVGDPRILATDIGPVIDQDALAKLVNHRHYLNSIGKLVGEAPNPNNTAGHFFPPCAYEIEHIHQIPGEIFGPILHIIRYSTAKLNQVIADIKSTGFGLTFGIHSRIDATIRHVTERVDVGNIYVNRNMIGAVVGVQPFGGEKLSGTGPKAGGPYYLPRLCIERAISVNTTAFGGNARLVSLLEED